jgi:hypothetical protein
VATLRGNVVFSSDGVNASQVYKFLNSYTIPMQSISDSIDGKNVSVGIVNSAFASNDVESSSDTAYLYVRYEKVFSATPNPNVPSILTYSATRVDGGPLPSFIQFDPAAGQLTCLSSRNVGVYIFSISATETISNDTLVIANFTLHVDDCGPGTCQHGGTCQEGQSMSEDDGAVAQILCDCPSSWIGNLCEDKDPFVLDAVLDKPLAAVLSVLVTLLVCAIVCVVYLVHIRQKQHTTHISELARRLLDTEGEMAVLQQAWLIRADDLVVEGEIARGAFGVVLKATWNDIPVAVKKLGRAAAHMSEEDALEFDREVSFMRTVRHPHIVLFFGAGSFDDGVPFMVVEYMERGSLGNVLRNSPDIAWPQKLQFAHDTALGMQHIHSLGSIHRDLKSGNLLGTKGFRIKVADFGTSRLTSMSSTNDRVRASDAESSADSRALTTMVGTTLWMAPEILFKQPYSLKADVYSYAMVLFEILTQQPPWNELPSKFLSNHVDAALREGRRPKIEGEPYSEGGYVGLMERCWAQAPEDRPTFDEVLEDAVFAIYSGR